MFKEAIKQRLLEDTMRRFVFNFIDGKKHVIENDKAEVEHAMNLMLEQFDLYENTSEVIEVTVGDEYVWPNYDDELLNAIHKAISMVGQDILYDSKRIGWLADGVESNFNGLDVQVVRSSYTAMMGLSPGCQRTKYWR